MMSRTKVLFIIRTLQLNYLRRMQDGHYMSTYPSPVFLRNRLPAHMLA
jgi:hypothetical protein